MIELFLRLVLGRELEWEELDANFTLLRDAIADKAAENHTHTVADIDGLQTWLTTNENSGNLYNIESEETLMVGSRKQRIIHGDLTNGGTVNVATHGKMIIWEGNLVNDGITINNGLIIIKT